MANESALARARSGNSLANDAAVIAGFRARGYSDVRPRENVYTYSAWLELGRQVRRGEKGVQIPTLVPKTIEENGIKRTVTIRRIVTVFHIDQTTTATPGATRSSTRSTRRGPWIDRTLRPTFTPASSAPAQTPAPAPTKTPAPADLCAIDSDPGF